MTDPREPHGRVVRDIWVAWAREQPDPKPSWLTGWDELDDGQREVDMRIGKELYDAGGFIRLSERERLRSEGAAAERQRVKQVVINHAAELGYDPDEVWGVAFPHMADFIHDLLDGATEPAGRVGLSDEQRAAMPGWASGIYHDDDGTTRYAP